MTSLMQFQGDVGERGVQLEFIYAPSEVDRARNVFALGPDTVECTVCGKEHDRIYVAWRKPRGTMGQFVVFRYNNNFHVPDLSLPIEVHKMPRGAKPLTNEETSQRWHR